MAVSDLKQALEQAEQQRVQGRYQEAMPVYGQILQAEPSNLRARLGMAHCLLNTGEFEQGLAHFRQAALDHPTSVEARLLYAKMLLMLDHTDEGKAQIARIQELADASIKRYALVD